MPETRRRKKLVKKRPEVLHLPPNIRYTPNGHRPSWNDDFIHGRMLNGHPFQESSEEDENDASPSPIIGLVYLRSSNMEREANLGIIILPEYLRRGYGSRVINDTLELAFEEFKLHRVQVLTMDWVGSSAAVRKLVRLGFTFEGTRRCLLVSPVDRQWKDVTTLSMLDADWHAQALIRSPTTGLWNTLFSRHNHDDDVAQTAKPRSPRRRLASQGLLKGSKFAEMFSVYSVSKPDVVN